MEQKVKFFKHDGKWMKRVPQSEDIEGDGWLCKGCLAKYDSDLCYAIKVGCGVVYDASIFQYPSEEELRKLPK